MKQYTSADEIFEKTMKKVAPLPCQEDYVRQLASILSFHVHKNTLMDDGISVDDLPSMSAVVVAPTGQGKTYLIRKMAEILDLNCIVVDCSTLAAEGWKGVGLGQRLLAAQQSGIKEEVFARSLLFLDEVDKIRYWGTSHDQGNPMTNILQLFNSGMVAAEDGRKGVNIDIKRFTILLGGAFEGIDEIVSERLQPKVKIGFSEHHERQAKQSKAELLQQVTMEDLSKFGMLPELLGRIGTTLSIKPMELEDYKQLLSAESGSVRKKYNTYLKNLYGVAFEITDAGTEAVARKCLNSGTGARAVTPLVNDLMRDALSEVERNGNICKVILDADGDDSCIIRYDYGNRSYSFHKFKQDPEAADQRAYPVIWIKARTPDRLAGRLCRFYANACKEDPVDMAILPELRVFLTCSLTYLSRYCRKDDFSFNSLGKLARILPREQYEKSTFEIMMEGQMADEPIYKEYLRLYDEKLAGKMVECLNTIMWYICEKRGEVVIRFALK